MRVIILINPKMHWPMTSFFFSLQVILSFNIPQGVFDHINK